MVTLWLVTLKKHQSWLSLYSTRICELLATLSMKMETPTQQKFQCEQGSELVSIADYGYINET